MGESTSTAGAGCKIKQENDKICVIYSLYGKHCFYVLDVGTRVNHSEPMPLPKEVLKISRKKYPSGMGYAILGSTIYCIGGMFFPEDKPSLDVYVFDTKKNEKSLTKLGPRLNAPKTRSPNTVVIQGKIYVFPKGFGKSDSSPRFEVFDPLEGTWTPLPEPFGEADIEKEEDQEWRWPDQSWNFRAKSHVVEGSKLIVSTPKGIHIFDVTKPHTGWTHVHTYHGVTDLPYGYGLVLADNGNMCFNQGYGYDTFCTAYDLSKDDALANQLCVLQLANKPCDDYRRKMVYYDSGSDGHESKINCCLASLGDDGENSRICRVRSSQKGYQRNSYILIEVFAFEKGYIKNNKEDNYYRGQDVLLLSNVHSSMFEVPDGDVYGSFITCFPM